MRTQLRTQLRTAFRIGTAAVAVIGISCFEEGHSMGLPCTSEEGCDGIYVCHQGFCLEEGETVLDDCRDGEQQKAEFCYFTEERIEVNLPAVTGRFLGQGDFNGDGRMDFAAMSNQDVFTSIFADGAYDRTMVFRQEDTQFIYGLSVGDIDGDGLADIMVMTDGTDFFVQTNAYINDGTGRNFTEVESNTFVDGEVTPALLGDFNGDMLPDAFFVDRDEGLKGFLAPGTGGGAFGPGDEIMAGTNTGDRFQALDVNADGIMDLIYLQRNNDLLTVLISRPFTPAMRIWTPELAIQLRTEPAPNDVVAHDVDGDGILDLTVSHEASQTVLLFTGNAGRDEIYRDDDRQMFMVPEADGAALADLDGDGEINLVTAGATRNVYRTAWGLLDFGTPIEGELRDVARLTLANVNDDDVPDFLVHERRDANQFKLFFYTANP